MGYDFEHQKEIAIAGFVAPFVGLVCSAVIHILDTIPADQTGLYTGVIWVAVLLLDVLASIEDVKSLFVNGPLFAICFGISFCLLNGISLKTFFGILFSAILVCCIVGAAYIIMRSRE